MYIEKKKDLDFSRVISSKVDLTISQVFGKLKQT